MPQPTSFGDLLSQVDAAFPDRLLRAEHTDPAVIAALHWRATGAREVIDWIKSLFEDPRDLAVNPEDHDEPLDPDDLVVGPRDED